MVVVRNFGKKVEQTVGQSLTKDATKYKQELKLHESRIPRPKRLYRGWRKDPGREDYRQNGMIMKK